MLGLKRKKKEAAPTDAAADENDDQDDVKEAEKAPAKAKDTGGDGDGKDAAPEKPAGKPAAEPAKPAGKMGLIIGFAVLTLIAGGAGAGAGMMFASSLEQVFMAKQKAEAELEKQKPPVPAKYSGDRVLQKIEPIITNLAAPADVWIRLESAIVFKNGSISDPQSVAAEIRQDILAYCRTITLDQLQGPSALQHLREDLSERVSLRTNGAVNELVIETMVVQ